MGSFRISPGSRHGQRGKGGGGKRSVLMLVLTNGNSVFKFTIQTMVKGKVALYN
jgi:hypothetical protein